MFVPMKVNEFWGSSDGFPSDAWFYSNGWEETLRPYYCETNKKWLLVWKPIPHEEAIQASREFYQTFSKILQYHSSAQAWMPFKQSAWERQGKRPPIRLWEQTAIEPSVLELLVERADPYHESNFMRWEKYPDVSPNVYAEVANHTLHGRFGSLTTYARQMATLTKQFSQSSRMPGLPPFTISEQDHSQRTAAQYVPTFLKPRNVGKSMSMDDWSMLSEVTRRPSLVLIPHGADNLISMGNYSSE